MPSEWVAGEGSRPRRAGRSPGALVLAAFALAAATPARAQAIVELYGALIPQLEWIATRDATLGGKPPGSASQVPASAFSGLTGSVARQVGNTTHLGFRGAAPLGHGYRAVFQLESGFQIDTGALNVPNQIFGRNSGLGVDTPFGRVLMGIWDTPYKAPTIPYGPVRGGISLDYPNIIGNPGFGVPPLTIQSTRTNTPSDAAFDRRQGNSVQYWTPLDRPLRARLMVGLGESFAPLVPGAPKSSPTVYSGNIEYAAGRFSGGLAYEVHQDYFGMSQIGGSAGPTATNPTSRDQGLKLFAQALVSNVRIAAILERLRYDNDQDATAGAINRYTRDAFYVLVQPRWGAHSVFATWMTAGAGSCDKVGGAPCSVQGLGATQVTAGYLYSLSRRTDLYLIALNLRNQSASTYNVLPPVAAGAGADVLGLGLGMTLYF